jgi:hypothetical protein
VIGLLVLGLGFLYFLSKGNFFKTNSQSVVKGGSGYPVARTRSQSAFSSPPASVLSGRSSSVPRK